MEKQMRMYFPITDSGSAAKGSSARPTNQTGDDLGTSDDLGVGADLDDGAGFDDQDLTDDAGSAEMGPETVSGTGLSAGSA